MSGRSDYAERRAARVERLERRADSARAEGQRRLGAADRIASGIPMGQPILVGHHSEKRHRADLRRMTEGTRAGLGKLKEAERLERAASVAASNNAISSDNPNAVPALEEKRLRLIGLVDRAKLVNATIRKAATRAKKAGTELAAEAIPALVAAGFSTEAATTALTKDFAGRIGVPAYELTNWGAEVRRISKRIAELQARDAAPEREPESFGAVTVREQENRVQLLFPGKPSEAVRSELKSYGFRWAPSEGAWQRLASNAAWYHARRIAQSIGAEP